MSNPGKLFKTNNGKYAIAYNCEQRDEFIKMNKLLVHLFEDEDFTQPLIINGKETILKSIERLSFIGFTD